jgi:hypothetical protein
MEKDTSQDTNESQNSFVECKLEIESVWSMNCITLNSRNNSCHVFDDDTSQAAKLNTSTIEQCYGDSYFLKDFSNVCKLCMYTITIIKFSLHKKMVVWFQLIRTKISASYFFPWPSCFCLGKDWIKKPEKPKLVLGGCYMCWSPQNSI